jgi:uncharacterized membrane protein (UPF0127 family)
MLRFTSILLIGTSPLFLAACREKTATMVDIGATEVVFPNGTKIRADYVHKNLDVMRGMMFVDFLEKDRGKLIVHGSEASFAYFMYQTKIPLDIIWISRQHQVVEISANTPPCPSKSASACPSYGGNKKAQFVLEVNAGIAAANGLKIGDFLDF